MNELSELKGYLVDSLNQLVQSAGAYLPNLMAAIILLLVGFLLATIAKWIILRLGAGIDRVIQAAGAGSLHMRLKWPITTILSRVVYWLIVLLFVRAALNSLQLPLLVDMVGKLFTYLPNVILGLVLIAGGTLLGNLVRDKITNSASTAGLRQPDQLGNWLRLGVIAIAIILGLSQIGLDVRLVEDLLTIIVAAVSGSIALAFGLGAGSTVSNIISARYLRKNYRLGQRISIQELEGKIMELTPTGVMLETRSGRTFIPAKIFADQASILLDNEVTNDR